MERRNHRFAMLHPRDDLDARTRLELLHLLRRQLVDRDNVIFCCLLIILIHSSADHLIRTSRLNDNKFSQVA